MPLWVPTLLIVVGTALALTATGSPTTAASGRRLWMAGILAVGCLAIAATVRLGLRDAEEGPALTGTSVPPRGSPAPPAPPGGPSASSLTFRIKVLEDHIRELEAGRHARSIPQQTADDLAAYLMQFGSRRIIVSCIPGDLEAYQYANQLVNTLKAAGWEAQGPQLTRIFGDVRSPAINVYVNGDIGSDTQKLLMAGFTKFNIPYQNRVAPSGAVPDSDAVELFVGTRQAGQVNANAN